MEVQSLMNIIKSEFYTGVPDSQLKTLCDYLMSVYGVNPRHHIIAANEGNSVAIASGYYLATNKVPVVYMQNSGEGNIINPLASLLHEKVYGIPMIFIIGWRGEPGVHDEPQHTFQGEITLTLLDDMDVSYSIIDKKTTAEELIPIMDKFNKLLEKGKNVAFVVKKGALTSSSNVVYKNSFLLNREDVIRHIVDVSGDDPIVSTTGKISRELFEIREDKTQSHKYDFLTVGSMGHASSIALGLSLNKQDKRIWCIDGDGAVLMHMGSLAVIGYYKPHNLVHIVINNGAHESVGGMPSVAGKVDISKIAESCGYQKCFCVNDLTTLDKTLRLAKNFNVLTFIEVKCSIGSRAELGRPTTTAVENKLSFMEYINT